ncbi:unnamed protein product [Ascophyllum nodosum]
MNRQLCLPGLPDLWVHRINRSGTYHIHDHDHVLHLWSDGWTGGKTRKPNDLMMHTISHEQKREKKTPTHRPTSRSRWGETSLVPPHQGKPALHDWQLSTHGY